MKVYLIQQNTKRNNQGYSLLELMVVISIIGIVLGLLYSYFNQGWKLYFKAAGFGYTQSQARSSLELLSKHLKEAASDMIFIGSGFNSEVPLPEDFISTKPYIYFVKNNYSGDRPANEELTEAINLQKQKSIRNDSRSYDYMLYYVAEAKSRDDIQDYSEEEYGQIKALVFKNQSTDYTDINSSKWPFLPKALQENLVANNKKNLFKIGLSSKSKIDEVSPEFSLYKSKLEFDYYNFSKFENIFSIDITLVDTKSDTIIHYTNAVSPRG